MESLKSLSLLLFGSHFRASICTYVLNNLKVNNIRHKCHYYYCMFMFICVGRVVRLYMGTWVCACMNACSLPFLSNTGIINTWHAHPAFYVDPRDWSRVLMLLGQAHYWDISPVSFLLLMKSKVKWMSLICRHMSSEKMHTQISLSEQVSGVLQTEGPLPPGAN